MIRPVLRLGTRVPAARRPILGVLAVAAAGILLAATTLLPRPAEGASMQLTVSPSTTSGGSGVTVDGSGFARHLAGSVVLDDAPSSAVGFRANGRGVFSVSLQVPVGESAGTHLVIATSSSGATLASTALSVVVYGATPAPTATPGGTPAPAPTATLGATPVPAPTATAAPNPTATVVPTAQPTPTVTTAPTVAPTATPAPTSVTYTFDDEFDGTSLGAVWGTSSHWTGLSEAVADRSMLSVANGVLQIKAERINGTWHAGELDTWSRYMPTYGYFEARVKFTSGKGLWPAFWLAHDWTGDKSELDINETLANPYVAGNCNTSAGYYATVHLSDGSAPAGSHCELPGGDLANAWHVYGMDWRADHITFYVDGVAWYTYRGTIPTASMAVVFNLAVGGWAGASDSTTPSPSYVWVDWVRVRA